MKRRESSVSLSARRRSRVTGRVMPRVGSRPGPFLTPGRGRSSMASSSSNPARNKPNGWEQPDRKGENVKHMSLKLVLVTALALATSGSLTGAASTATSGSGPTFKHVGPLAFGPDGVLFVADSQDVSITALQLATQMAGGTPGTKDVSAINQKIAALLGIDAKNLLITDMIVNPKTGNAFISAMRGLGADAKPVLLRVDGAGK